MPRTIPKEIGDGRISSFLLRLGYSVTIRGSSWREELFRGVLLTTGLSVTLNKDRTLLVDVS